MKKFCIHISGMDDIIPVHSVREAVRASAYLNASYIDAMQDMDKHHDQEVTPICFAVPMVWPGSDECHQEELEHLKARAKAEGTVYWMLY